MNRVGNVIKRIDLIHLVSLLLGVFVTMPLISVSVFGRNISIFSFVFGFFILILFFLLIKERVKIKIEKNCKIFLFWLLLALLSSIYGLYYFNQLPGWRSAVASYIPKLFAYAITLILIANNKNRELIIKTFFIGFFAGCVLNIVWSNLEGMLYYSTGRLLNNIVFSRYLDNLPINRQFLTITTEHGIRTAGLNYDPAHLGGLIPITFLVGLFRKKIVLILLSITALGFSQSTTALVTILIISILNNKKIRIFFGEMRINKRRAMILISSIAIAFALMFFLQNDILSGLFKNAQGFWNRIRDIYINSESGNLRVLYHIYLPAAILFSGVNVFTGYGFGVASYPFVSSQKIMDAFGSSAQKFMPYDPESTYLSYLFNVGLMGLLLYMYILYKLYEHYSKKYRDKTFDIIFFSICAIIFSGFFYHYILTAYQVLIIIMATILMSSTDREAYGDSVWKRILKE